MADVTSSTFTKSDLVMDDIEEDTESVRGAIHGDLLFPNDLLRCLASFAKYPAHEAERRRDGTRSQQAEGTPGGSRIGT